MSSVRRPDRGDALPQGMPGVPLPESTADEVDTAPALLSVDADSHLLPCRHCGVLNGRSAAICWGCEADLLMAGPFGAVMAPEPAPQPAPPEPPLRRGLHLVARNGAPPDALLPPPMEKVEPALVDDEVTLPVLTSSVDVVESDAPVIDLAVPAVTAVSLVDVELPETRAPWPRGKMAIAVLFVGLVTAGAYFQFRAPAPGGVEQTSPPPAVNVPPAATPQAAVVDVPPGPSSGSAETKGGSGSGARAEGPIARPPPSAGRARPAETASAETGATERPTNRSRNTTRAVGTIGAAPVTAAVPARPEVARPTPPAPPGPCTATVAALGLCSPASTPSTKE